MARPSLWRCACAQLVEGVYVYVYMCTCVHVCMWVCVRVHASMRTYMFGREHVCVRACMRGAWRKCVGDVCKRMRTWVCVPTSQQAARPRVQ